MSGTKGFPDPQNCLDATPLIDADHSEIRCAAARIIGGSDDHLRQAEKIFYFVRDSIIYSFSVTRQEPSFRASAVLRRGRGFCTQKAILFCALARSCGIPAALAFYDILDNTLSPVLVRLLGGHMLYRHGIPALWLGGRWMQYDPTLEAALARRKGMSPVDFREDRDSLMPPQKEDGGPAIEYRVFHGMQEDVSFQEIASWMKAAYPRLVPETERNMS